MMLSGIKFQNSHCNMISLNAVLVVITDILPIYWDDCSERKAVVEWDVIEVKGPDLVGFSLFWPWIMRLTYEQFCLVSCIQTQYK